MVVLCKKEAQGCPEEGGSDPCWLVRLVGLVIHLFEMWPAAGPLSLPGGPACFRCSSELRSLGPRVSDDSWVTPLVLVGLRDSCDQPTRDFCDQPILREWSWTQRWLVRLVGLLTNLPVRGSLPGGP